MWRQNAPNISNLLATILVVLVVIYFQVSLVSFNLCVTYDDTLPFLFAGHSQALSKVRPN